VAFDTGTADSILKIDYQGPVRETLNNSTILLSRVRRNTTDFVGKQAYLPIHKGRNTGVGARLEGGALPTAGNQQYDKAIYNVKYLYGAIELTGPSIKAAKNNVGAFVRGIQSEMEGLVTDLKVDVNRQLWHDGSSILTQVNNTATTAVCVVQSTKFLQVGMQIQIFTSNGATERIPTTASTNFKVASIESATSFTLSDTSTAARTATDVIIRRLARDSANWTVHQEMFGLESLVSASNPGNGITSSTGGLVGQIDRTGNPWWQSGSFFNTTPGTLRPLTLDLLQQAYDQSEIEGDTEPGLILTNHAGKRRYASLLVADKRYPAGGEIKLDGGYSALELNGVPMVADKDGSIALGTNNTLNRYYFLSMSSLELQVLEDWGWLDEDGHVLKAKTGGSTASYADAWQAFMAAYMELAVNRPNANVVLGDIDESP